MNLNEIMVMFVALSTGLGQPMNAVQLLWINLLSDLAPGLTLAMEPPEPEVLQQPPRDQEEPIIPSADFKRIGFEAAVLSAGTLGAYGYSLLRYDIGAQANTLAFSSLTVGQLLHAFSWRSQTHHVLGTTSLSALVAQHFDFCLASIIRQFQLRFLPTRVPGGFYQKLASYGYVGRMAIGLPWGVTDKADLLQEHKK
jgi:magnesium-transporting ATPase (P-type)